MTALHKLLAVEKTRKNVAERAKTGVYHAAQRTALFVGLTRTYAPIAEDGETMPDEETFPQLRGDQLLNEFRDAQAALLDLVASKDEGNTAARADVVVGGEVLLPQVPVTTLLFLEKQATDLRAMISKLPVQDPTIVWTWDPSTSLYRSRPEQTNRGKKVPRVLMKAPATDRHQADTEVWHEDVVVGRYTTTRFTSALPAETIRVYGERIEAFLEAVKTAREEANTHDVGEVHVGQKIFSYVLGPVG